MQWEYIVGKPMTADFTIELVVEVYHLSDEFGEKRVGCFRDPKKAEDFAKDKPRHKRREVYALTRGNEGYILGGAITISI